MLTDSYLSSPLFSPREQQSFVTTSNSMWRVYVDRYAMSTAKSLRNFPFLASSSRRGLYQTNEESCILEF